MLNFVKIASSAIVKTQRVLKFLRYGLKDVQTADEVAPFGIDSAPIKDLIAVYGSTDDDPVIIGYLNKNQLAGIGEFRTYSTDANGALKFYTWLKSDGTMELGGNTKNLARYQDLEAAFNQLKSDHDDLVNAFNTHMHPTAGTGAPSPPTPGSGIPAMPSTADITGAKIEEIKTL